VAGSLVGDLSSPYSLFQLLAGVRCSGHAKSSTEIRRLFSFVGLFPFGWASFILKVETSKASHYLSWAPGDTVLSSSTNFSAFFQLASIDLAPLSSS